MDESRAAGWLRYRIYFNRLADYPLIWSYDEGTQATEACVAGFRLHGCDAEHGQHMNVATGSTTAPRVWIAVRATRVEIHSRIAHFYAE